ncbi:MAG: ferritin-like domain-containing protein [Segetibacter sp.]
MARATGKKAAAPKKAAAKKAAVPAKKAATPIKKTATKTVAPLKKAAAKAAPPKKAAAKKATAAPAKKVALKKVGVKSAPQAAPKKAVVKSDETMLQELFLDSIKDIYWAEKSLSKTLPRLAKAATSPQLRQAFEEHAQETNGQIGRLEQVFTALGKKAQGVKCEAMEGLTKEADNMIKETKKGSKTRDVALIMAAQKAEHYEIATYGSLATLAAISGLSEIEELLGQTLQEEKNADSKLTQIAEGSINEQAEEEGSESQEKKSQGSEGKDSDSKKDVKLDPEAGDDGNTKH